MPNLSKKSVTPNKKSVENINKLLNALGIKLTTRSHSNTVNIIHNRLNKAGIRLTSR